MPGSYQVLNSHLLKNEWQLSPYHPTPTVFKDIRYLMKVKQQSRGYKSALNEMRHKTLFSALVW